MKTVLQILEYKMFKVTRFCNPSVQTWQESTTKIIIQTKLEGAMRIREKNAFLANNELDGT